MSNFCSWRPVGPASDHDRLFDDGAADQVARVDHWRGNRMRGFFIWELRKVLPFGGVSLVSGLIWAVWHFPIIIAYGGGVPAIQLGCFSLMIVSMSVIMTYFTFRSESLWPAVFFHAAHNIFIQKIFTPLTEQNETTAFWIDEYGLMIPIIVTFVAPFYWRKAKAEGM